MSEAVSGWSQLPEVAGVRSMHDAHTYLFVRRGDFKRNEQLIMARLDQAEKQFKGNDKKKGGNMKDAVDSTEQIRQWVSTVTRG